MAREDAVVAVAPETSSPVGSEVSATASLAQLAVPGGVRVLVADDEPTLRRAVSVALARLGFDVLQADDGTSAIALAERTPPDLALVDLDMPTSGIEVLRYLKRARGPGVHVSILSGSDDEPTRLGSFDAGADDFITKPISIRELQRRVVAAARSQQAYIDARQSREQADRLLAWGSEATALLAHDLNNGLAVALSNISYLSQVLEIGEDDREAMTSTLRALRRMSGLVANFVDIGRFEDDALQPRCAPVKLRALLLEVMALHAPSMSRQIRHVVACDAELQGWFDEALIMRVLHNLVGNSVRYCNPAGTIRLAATPWADDERAGVEITIHNSGPQVPAALIPKLFKKYALGKDGQRGLGLYFCRLALEAHGGTVAYDPLPAGPCFVLRLPNPRTPPG